MTAQRIIGLLALAWAVPLFGQFESTVLKIPTNAVIRLDFEKTNFLIGESIFANYVISNGGGSVVRVSTGGDYRGGTRAHRFNVTAVRSDGYIAPDPEPFQWRMGGFGGDRDLRSGSNWFEHVRIARYCEITEPGDYTLTVFHDLGWGPRQSNDVREVTAKLRLRLPTKDEARALVEHTLSAPEHTGWTWGERGWQLPDITVLYHPIYLPALIEQAEKGSSTAITGINSVRTAAGTEALVHLMVAPRRRADSATTNALLAARYLEARLPKPPPPVDYNIAEQEPLRRRLQATWNPRFAEPVRQFARSQLLTTNHDALLLAASELSVVGRNGDFELLKSALERAATLTDTQWQSDHGYPYHQSVARSLAATAFKLGVGSHDFSKPKNAGEALLFLGYLRQTNAARPQNWERTSLGLLRDSSAFIRAETAWAIPKPAPAQIQQEFVKLMLDSDVAVRNWALEALRNVRSPTIRSNALRVLSSTSDRWLFSAAVSLAMTNDARAEAAEIIAARFNDSLNGPGSTMPHEATRALFEIVSGGGHVSGGFSDDIDTGTQKARWQQFIVQHRSELEQGRRFAPNDDSGLGALLSAGWQFYPPNESRK